MRRGWTIDTCVLYRAADADVNAAYFLLAILQKGHAVTLDDEGFIEQQYRRCLRRVKRERRSEFRLVDKWFVQAVGKLAQKFSGKLPRRHQIKLEKLRFHRKDWPFVGVCAKTGSKSLVSEDSDYTEKVREYLEEQMEVHVLSVKDSLKIAG